MEVTKSPPHPSLPTLAWELSRNQTTSSEGLPFNFQHNGHSFILFYRWFSNTSTVYERGRIVARFVADELYALNAPTWLDQYHMPQDLGPDEVVRRIQPIFEQTSQVVILAGPGDWTRFAADGDIHRWEWEMSLRSGKPIWLLLYDFPPSTALMTKADLVAHLQTFDVNLAELVSCGRVNIRTIFMENARAIMKDIAATQ